MCPLTWAVYSNFRIIYDCCCRCPFNINRPWGPSNRQEIFYWSLSSVIIHLCIHNWEMLCMLSYTVANYLCKSFCSWSMFGSEMVRSLRRLKRWQRIEFSLVTSKKSTSIVCTIIVLNHHLIIIGYWSSRLNKKIDCFARPIVNFNLCYPSFQWGDRMSNADTNQFTFRIEFFLQLIYIW